MKNYWQFILELTAYQRLEKDSWKKAAARKIITPKSTVKKSLPWAGGNKEIVGFYHPTKQSFTFTWATNNYHITEIVKRPQLFDITEKEIIEALEKLNIKQKNKKQNYKVRHGTKEYTLNSKTAQDTLRLLLDGEIDHLPNITNLALDKGWAMIGIEKTQIEIRANSTETHKSAVREILEVGVGQGKMIRIRNERNHSKDLSLLFQEDMEKFLHS